jgi:hypothetical protein
MAANRALSSLGSSQTERAAAMGELAACRTAQEGAVAQPHKLAQAMVDAGPSARSSKFPDTIKQGFLEKQGGTLKNWCRRYFVLTEEKLEYYQERVFAFVTRVHPSVRQEQRMHSKY